MADGRNSTPPGAAEPPTVTTLHARWERTLDKLDLLPGLPNPRRLGRLDAARDTEWTIIKTPARTVAEIILKLTMVQSGRITGMVESGMLGSAIGDLRRLDRGTPIPVR